MLVLISKCQQNFILTCLSVGLVIKVCYCCVNVQLVGSRH